MTTGSERVRCRLSVTDSGSLMRQQRPRTRDSRGRLRGLRGKWLSGKASTRVRLPLLRRKMMQSRRKWRITMRRWQSIKVGCGIWRLTMTHMRSS
jgi:hypothetical protein